MRYGVFLDSPSQDGRLSAPGSDRVSGIQAGGCEKGSADFYFGFFNKIVLPALVISLIWENHTTVFTLFHYGRIVLWQMGAYLLLALTGFLVSRIFKLPESVRNVFACCMVGGNFGFLVIPLIMALFAETGGDKYIPICSVVDTTVVWTLGLLLFLGRAGNRKISGRGLSAPLFLFLY